MTTKSIQKKFFILLILGILILIPFVYAVDSDTYKNPDGSPLSIPSSGSPATPSTTTPATTPTDPTSESYLDWIKKNAKGVEVKETKALLGFGKVTGAVATFTSADGELKLKKPDGTEYSVSGIVPEKEGKKAKVTLNADGTIKEAQLTVSKDSKAPLYLYLDNTKLEIPQGASVDYNKANNKAVVALKGGTLSEMPQQIDPAKKDGLKVNYEAEETTQLPNGIVLEKAEKGFSESTITSTDGKDYISIGNAARLNGMNGYNAKYSDNVNSDVEILGLREKVSKTDMSSGKTAKENYILIDVKNKVFETGAGKGKTGLIINPNNENDFITGVKENSFFAYQPRNGGILQITKQGNNLPSLVDTYGEFVFGSGTHNYYHKGDGKILVDSIPGIPGIGFDRDAKDIASVPFIMKNHDSNGKEINKDYMVVMNDNNGYAMVPVGTTEAKLSNGDVWKTSLSSRVSPPGVQETPADLPLPVPPATVPNIPIPETPIPNPAAQPNQPPQKVSDMIMSSSVRINVRDSNGNSVGSGTIIGDDGKGNAIIATCSHTFRDSGYRGAIKIDTFSPQQSGSLQGVVGKSGVSARLIDYDAQRDVALVSVPKDQIGNFMSARVAPQNFRVAPGQASFSAGCTHGQDCTVWNDKIAGINKFLGPPNIVTSRLTIEGRSGGGLFTSSGVLVGILNAADPSDKQGLYADISNIQPMLDKHGLSGLYKK